MHVYCAQSREALLLVLSSRQARKGGGLGTRESGNRRVRAERGGSAGQVLVQMETPETNEFSR